MTISCAFPRAGDAMAALFLTAGLFQAVPARADVVFDFSGTCKTNCTGTATGVLTLADSYVFGGFITDANFISFDYSSSSRSFDITSADDPGFIGGLNADSSYVTGEVVFAASGGAGLPAFQAALGGFVAETMPGGATDDVGLSSSLTPVSGAVTEPSTWAMMLLGFAGLGYAGGAR
jgi:hypothetical protein